MVWFSTVIKYVCVIVFATLLHETNTKLVYSFEY